MLLQLFQQPFFAAESIAAMDEINLFTGKAQYQRIIERWSWTVTAEKTVEQYRARLAEPTVSLQGPGLGDLPSLPSLSLPSLDDVGGALAGLRRRLPV